MNIILKHNPLEVIFIMIKYFNIKSKNVYKIFYRDLFDYNDAFGYGMAGDTTTFSSDLPIYRFGNIEWYRIDKGDKKSALDHNVRCQIAGYYEATSTNTATLLIEPTDKRWWNSPHEIKYLPCTILYDDTSVEASFFNVDNTKIAVHLNPEKTLKRVMFNTEYWFNTSWIDE